MKDSFFYLCYRIEPFFDLLGNVKYLACSNVIYASTDLYILLFMIILGLNNIILIFALIIIVDILGYILFPEVQYNKAKRKYKLEPQRLRKKRSWAVAAYIFSPFLLLGLFCLVKN